MNVIDTFRLDGRVAILTGAAGVYGRQMLEALVEAGAKVYIAARNLEALEALAAKHNANGGNVIAVRYDQADEASILALRDRVLLDCGRIDILVNNSYSPPVEFDAPAEAFMCSLQVNCLGVFLISRAIGDVMAEAGRGSIINIGSIFGVLGPDKWVCEGNTHRWALPDYYVHKGAMLNMTRFMAAYYGERNVRCNCIAAGGLKSENVQDAYEQNYNRTTCLGRMADDTDMKGIIVFLASDASAYITGANIAVDGGRTAI